MLGGVRFDSDWGLVGHSDADVLLHAVGDALLGAAGLGDLGEHFPPGDPKWKNASSLVLLDRIAALMRERGASVVNVDATLIAESPRLAPHRAAMCASIARAIGIDAGRVSVKATTNEMLGSIGRREGLAAMAVALVGDFAGATIARQSGEICVSQAKRAEWLSAGPCSLAGIGSYFAP